MSNIRCDNAECIVYVDELAREFPHEFVLEISPRPLSVGHPGHGERPFVDRYAGVPHDREASRPGRGTERVVEQRRRASRPAPRPAGRLQRRKASHAFVLHAAHARRATVLIARVARCTVARRVQAVVDPGRGHNG